MRRYGVVFFFAALVSLYACGGKQGDSCNTSADCPSGDICIGSSVQTDMGMSTPQLFCEHPCTTDADCVNSVDDHFGPTLACGMTTGGTKICVYKF